MTVIILLVDPVYGAFGSFINAREKLETHKCADDWVAGYFNMPKEKNETVLALTFAEKSLSDIERECPHFFGGKYTDG